jgi:homoprotocatechuate degradation regulator HpaR
MGRFRPILNKHGVTEQQWRIVRALIDAARPMEPHEIGRICRISSPSLAGMLARMEELKLVSRKRLSHDQRRILVSLTAHSRSLAARMAPHIEGAYAEMEEALGPDFVEQCYAMLDHIGVALAPRADEPDRQ